MSYFFHFCPKCALTRVFSRHIFLADFVGFLFFYFCRFLLFFLLFHEMKPKLFVLELRHLIVTVFWPFS